ncbi:FtsW/RodA/SpoVE family cell cycle protein [Vagococcus sp. DIV0080]|uniref:Probable peptidoglycan glycosyltransferase FtsW n=1 Tax=Candidatus Vagococcus giribetii TaxID=2230876 RepID=A0ABS3HSL4_9ENTE|nr:FtsW/RodA/SpoVE family cell cycle protein [Vagococcus sp. DIV0080]MBO0476742.1 FtsW/RodA/SpoVE family cell cycle protein [Vagococcus sp. DIV0080]
MINKFKLLDFKILIPYIILNITGIIMIFSASSYNLDQKGLSSMSIASKQLFFLIVSVIMIMVIYRTNLKIYQTSFFNKMLISASAIVLIATSVLGLGQTIGGAQRWIDIGPISIQPSEFIMITIIIYSSYIFSVKQNKIGSQLKETVVGPSIIVGILILLVFIQPNVGGAAILTMIYLAILFSSGIPYLYMVVGAGFTAVFAFIMTQLVMFKDGFLLPGKFSHVYDRFSVMKDPFSDQLGNGFQLVNSYYAIYNGGWFGLGLGQSIQKKGFLPVAETDFIFSVTIEELGLIRSFIILGLLLFLILRIFAIGIQATTSFNSLVAIGVGSAILIQVFVNLGGILGIIPMTGVPFPFMSYGGSNLLTLSILIGIVLNISADEKRRKIYTLALSMA